MLNRPFSTKVPDHSPKQEGTCSGNHQFVFGPCDADGFFYDNSGRTDSLPNNLVGPKPSVSSKAVFSVLQFGAIMPPLSPWTGIHRFMPGYKYQGTRNIGPISIPQNEALYKLDPEHQADQIEVLLDAVLKRHIAEDDDPVLLFSGGVDSGIIASRLAALGFQNSLLINFAFGKNDPESKLAEQMANHLGLKFERLCGEDFSCGLLDNPGKIYPQPFGDHSTAPTWSLASSLVKFLSGQKRIVIDGTGADGAFGMSQKIKAWNALYRMPNLARHLASVCYARMLWWRNGYAERIGRVCRRSSQMPMLSAIMAQNPLSGIAYCERIDNSIDQEFESWIGGWAGESKVRRMVAGDLALTCANIFAQKAKPILEAAGHKTLYPFLEDEVIYSALDVAPHWQMNEPKAPLKRALARQLPHNMVYRAKSGFVDPEGELFFNSDFIEHLRCAAEPSSPIVHFLRVKAIQKACKCLAQKKALPPQTLNLIWAVVFMDRWYRTAFD